MLYKDEMENTPVGTITLVSTQDFLVKLDFSQSDARETTKYLTKYFGQPVFSAEHCETLKKARRQLEEYFQGNRKTFDLEMRVFGTDFYLNCWNSLRAVAYGETISYKELALRAGSPKGYRAVGQANHNNPIPVIIPCHRVLASNGGLGGFGGGIENKKILLELEQKHSG